MCVDEYHFLLERDKVQQLFYTYFSFLFKKLKQRKLVQISKQMEHEGV